MTNESSPVETVQAPTGQSITITLNSSPTQNPPVKEDMATSSEGNSEESEVKRQQDVEKLVPKGDYRTDKLFYEVANYFGLKEQEYDGAVNKLGDIVEFVIRDIESNDVEKVLMRIKEIERSIGNPGWEERRYANFHKYIRLADKKNTIEKMMKVYEK